MDEDPDAPGRAAPRKAAPASEEREARLAAALRANLRRRKASPSKPQPKADR